MHAVPGMVGAVPPELSSMAGLLAWVNGSMAVLNLVPVPSWDGGRILAAFRSRG